MFFFTQNNVSIKGELSATCYHKAAIYASIISLKAREIQYIKHKTFILPRAIVTSQSYRHYLQIGSDARDLLLHLNLLLNIQLRDLFLQPLVGDFKHKAFSQHVEKKLPGLVWIVWIRYLLGKIEQTRNFGLRKVWYNTIQNFCNVSIAHNTL